MTREPKPSKALTRRTWLVIASVIALGALTIFFREQLFNSNQQDRNILGKGFAVRSSDRETKFDSSLQNSMSRFFSGIQTNTSPIEDDTSPYVIELQKTPVPLNEVLMRLAQEVASNNKPLPADWQGQNDEHWFMPDETIKQRLEEIALAENMTFIWWLDRDYIVKSPFQVKADFVGLAREVAITVNDDYQGNVAAFICSEQRALLISEAAVDATHNCQPVIPTQTAKEPDPDALPNLQLKNGRPG